MHDPSPRFMRLLVLRMLVLASAVAVVFFLLTSAGAGEPPAGTSSHVVAAGETLWEIASDVAEEGSDLRRTVAAIVELNDLDDAVIHPGQVLILPAG